MSSRIVRIFTWRRLFVDFWKVWIVLWFSTQTRSDSEDCGSIFRLQGCLHISSLEKIKMIVNTYQISLYIVYGGEKY